MPLKKKKKTAPRKNMSVVVLQIPDRLRIGQNIESFRAFCKGYSYKDLFHVSNSQFHKLYAEFIEVNAPQ